MRNYNTIVKQNKKEANGKAFQKVIVVQMYDRLLLGVQTTQASECVVLPHNQTMMGVLYLFLH
jgi:hypothetical protein